MSGKGKKGEGAAAAAPAAAAKGADIIAPDNDKPIFTQMRNMCSRIKTWVIEALKFLVVVLVLIVCVWFQEETSPGVSRVRKLEEKLEKLNQHNSATASVFPALKSYPDPAAEFVMGVVSAPASGGVAQSLARLLVSSKVRPPPSPALAPAEIVI